MIPDSILNSLYLSFSEDVVGRAVEKYERAFRAGKVKSESDRGTEAYLRKICESDLKPQDKKKADYALYRAENEFTELMKENPNFRKETFHKIHSLPNPLIEEIKRVARSHYWFTKRISEFKSPLNDAEQAKLENMFYNNKRAGSDLTPEERAISDKVMKAYQDFESTVLIESMCVVFHWRYRAIYNKLNEA